MMEQKGNFRQVIKRLLSLEEKVAVMEDRVLDLERDIFFLEKLVSYGRNAHEDVQRGLANKQLYFEFEKFERHIARLEHIFA